jgi:hypothetical protein
MAAPTPQLISLAILPSYHPARATRATCVTRTPTPAQPLRRAAQSHDTGYSLARAAAHVKWRANASKGVHGLGAGPGSAGSAERAGWLSWSNSFSLFSRPTWSAAVVCLPTSKVSIGS